MTDIVPSATETACTGDAKNGPFKMSFDDIIITTGHDWPTEGDGPFAETPEGITAETVDGPQTFAVVIDARGQPSAPLESLPFPTLASHIEANQTGLFAPYRLMLNQAATGRIYRLAMPQVLCSNPFAQGLANCAALSKRAVEDLLLQSANGPATAKAA